MNIRQQELKLEHRHAQLKEQLNTRLSCSSKYIYQILLVIVFTNSLFFFCVIIELEKSTSDVAAEGAILNEMLEIVAKRATLRPTDTLLQSQQLRSSLDAIESDVS